MKKKLRTIFAAALLGCAVMFPTVANAQKKGEMTLGVAGGFATENNGGYVNAFFQYTAAPHVRIAPEIGYVFRNEGKSAFEMSADVQFPFRVAKGLSLYPLAGVTLNSWNHVHHNTQTRVGADFGGGFDIYLTSNLKLNFQGKYSLMNDYSGGFFDMGIGYVF